MLEVGCWRLEVGGWLEVGELYVCLMVFAMATIRRFEDLEVWKMARVQAIEINKLTQVGSFLKDFELRAQINRSAGSVMDNIAEGFERFTNKEFMHHLIIAKGSNGELRSQLYRAFDRAHLSNEILTIRMDYSTILGNKIKAFTDYLYASKFKNKPRKPGRE